MTRPADHPLATARACELARAAVGRLPRHAANDSEREPLVVVLRDVRWTGVRASHMCYGGDMDVASRELRNNTRAVLQLVEAGEAVTITVDGRPIAVLEPLSRRRQWISREEFIRHIARRPADPALRSELRALAPDTTDDLTR